MMAQKATQELFKAELKLIHLGIMTNNCSMKSMANEETLVK